MLSSSRVITIVAVLALTLNARWAIACSCAGPLPPLKAMATASAVFTGKVITLTKTGTTPNDPEFFEGYEVTLQVGIVIKGKSLKSKHKTVAIRTGSGFGDCGYEFEVGTQYLIYAYGIPSKLETNTCTRTKPLRDTGEEVIELRGKLPKIPTPPHPPQVVLKGRINDAGYRGYVFEFQNYLHERIFYDEFRTQVFRNGKWEDYPSNQGVEPGLELSQEAVAEMLRQERAESAQVETPLGRQGPRGRFSYLGRLNGTQVFATIQSQAYPWRVGFQYQTESALDAGKRLYKSTKYVWGPPIENSTKVQDLNFEEAFSGRVMIPHPFGEKETAPEPTKK